MKKIKPRKHGNEKKNIHLFLTCQKYPEVSNEKNKWAEPSGRKIQGMLNSGKESF